jgi:hypothetical protein
MGKIVFWIVVFFVVLLALRLVNVAAAKRRRGGERGHKERQRELTAEPTVRCAECGTFLPKSEAQPTSNGYRCNDPGCPRRR